MTDNQWGEIFNLTEELKRIEEEVDKRLEETLAEDPHVIEQETVHYGVQGAAEDRAEQFRMRQTLPLFGPLGGVGVTDAAQDMPAGDIAETRENEASPVGAGASMAGTEDEMPQSAPDDVAAAAAAWDDAGPIGDYVAPRAAESVLQEPEAVQTVADSPGKEEGGDTFHAQNTEPAAETEPCEDVALPEDAPAESDPSLVKEHVEELDGTDTDLVEPDSKGTNVVDADLAEPDAKGTKVVDADLVEPDAKGTKVVDADLAEPDSKGTKVVDADPVHADPGTVTSPRIAEAATTHRRQILVALIAVIVVLAALLGVLYYQKEVVPGGQYREAETLYANGQYDEAIAAFTQIRTYKDAASRITEIEYARADEFVNAGDYQEAVDYIDNLREPTDAMLQLRSSAIYQIAMQYYEEGNLGAAEGELLTIKDYVSGDDVAIDFLHEIQYQEASEALAVYDFDTAEPILASLGDYKDAAILLAQVENAIDIVYTDVARDDDGEEIEGRTEYLWVHSVITPGAIAAGTTEAQETAADGTADAAASVQTENESADSTESNTEKESAAQAYDDSAIEAIRALAGATDDVDDEAVHVLMMHMDTTDAAMTYEDAEPILSDHATIVTKDISSYAAIDDTFGSDQMTYSPQTLQRSNTDYALAFEGSESYAARNRADDEVRMECKMAEDGYWCKTRRVYAEMDEDNHLVGVPKAQLRTWTRVLNESLADEVRAGFLAAMQ